MGDSMGRWKEFMERGPDRLPTYESEEYEDGDSADEANIASEVSQKDQSQIIANNIRSLIINNDSRQFNNELKNVNDYVNEINNISNSHNLLAENIAKAEEFKLQLHPI